MNRKLIKWLIALVCVMLVSYSMSLISERVTFDLTAENLSVLSHGTVQTLETLAEDVEIHLIYRAETDNSARTMLSTLAESYAKHPHVSADTVDPVTEPGRLSAYQTAGHTLQEGSAVVACGDRFEVIDAKNMFTYTVSSSGKYSLTGICAEQRFTAAIRAVSGEESINVYFLTGHGEADETYCTELTARLKEANYNVGNFDPVGKTLQMNDVLLILSPSIDLTEEEYTAISEWMDAGGRLFFACDATVDLTAIPNFSCLAERFSLRFEPGLVVESDAMPAYWVSSPLYLMPKVNTDAVSVTGFPTDGRVLLPGARAISGPEIPLSGCSCEALLTTSPDAYIKQTDSEAFVREDGDPCGTQNLAVSAVYMNEESGAECRAVFMGTLYTAMDNSLLQSSANLEWMCAAVNFLAEREDAVNVPVRAAGDTTMVIPSASEAITMAGIALALPVLTVLIGAAVLLRRRRK